jgi:hypothetical protein
VRGAPIKAILRSIEPITFVDNNATMSERSNQALKSIMSAQADRSAETNPEAAEPRIHFSLKTLFLGIFFFCYFVWFGTLVIPKLPQDAPPSFWVVQMCFVALWISLIVGSFVLGSAWWYVVGGCAGNVLASPISFAALHQQQFAVLFWWMLMVFALFGCLVGGVACLRNEKYKMGVENLMASGMSFIVLVSTIN